MYSGFDNLCYSMKVKTKEIIKKNKEVKTLGRNVTIVTFLLMIAAFFIAININIYAEYFSYKITGYGSYSRTPGKIDALLFGFLGVCCYFAIIYSHEYNNLKKKFEIIRQDIIDNIGKEFCKCNNSCSCREEYIKYMKDKEHIDLIFKNIQI